MASTDGDGNETPQFDEIVDTPFGVLARRGRFIYHENLLDQDEHEELVRQIVGEGVPALRKQRQELRDEMLLLLSKGDPYELLIQFAVPYLSYDPNTFKEWAADRTPAHVEYLALQVLASGDPDAEPEMWEPQEIAPVLARLAEIVPELFRIEASLLIFTPPSQAGEPLSRIESELRFATLSYSLAVRLPAYAEHEEATLRGLMAGLSDLLEEQLGFTIDAALDVVEAVGRLMQERLNERLDRMREELKRMKKQVKRARRKGRATEPIYEALAELSPKVADQQLRQVLTAWVFFGSRLTFAVTADDVAEACPDVSAETATAVMDLLSASRADFSSEHHLFPCPTHPLRIQPLLSVRGGWLAPVVVGLLFGLRPMIERKLEESPEAWDRYQAARSRYLENEAKTLLAKGLGASDSWGQLEWASTDDSGDLDVLVAEDVVTVWAECKAGRFTDSARRGGIRRLETEFRELIGDAASQLGRLRRAVQTEGAAAIGIEEQAEALTKPLRIEAVVTLDDLTPFGAEAFKLQEFGTLSPDEPVPWIISLNDLRIVVDILGGPEFVHYMLRRQRLNRIGRVIALDEADWLGHYVAEGLFFDEFFAEDDKMFLRLSSYTEDMDSWYLFRAGARTVEATRPQQEIRPLMRDALDGLRRVRRPNYMIPALAMLDWGADGRDAYEHHMRAAIERAATQGSASFSLGTTGGIRFSVLVSPGDTLDQAAAVLAAGLERVRKSEPDFAVYAGVATTRQGHYSPHVVAADLCSALDAVFREPGLGNDS